eukprot:TRINITY_DN16444_c0_g1_i4.p1 TRINITY_DN16444_c0_g1~~TRINITY_DN16444_c0_g1_i4.p1  ORF type:complete len:1964 (+),score=656.24 TRINITY_DN16444_c0_g1_i4:135-6026(+)
MAEKQDELLERPTFVRLKFLGLGWHEEGKPELPERGDTRDVKVASMEDLAQEVAKWLGAPGCWQLMTAANWPLTADVIRRPTASKCPLVVNVHSSHEVLVQRLEYLARRHGELEAKLHDHTSEATTHEARMLHVEESLNELRTHGIELKHRAHRGPRADRCDVAFKWLVALGLAFFMVYILYWTLALNLQITSWRKTMKYDMDSNTDKIGHLRTVLDEKVKHLDKNYDAVLDNTAGLRKRLRLQEAKVSDEVDRSADKLNSTWGKRFDEEAQKVTDSEAYLIGSLSRQLSKLSGDLRATNRRLDRVSERQTGNVENLNATMKLQRNDVHKVVERILKRMSQEHSEREDEQSKLQSELLFQEEQLQTLNDSLLVNDAQDHEREVTTKRHISGLLDVISKHHGELKVVNSAVKEVNNTVKTVNRSLHERSDEADGYIRKLNKRMDGLNGSLSSDEDRMTTVMDRLIHDEKRLKKHAEKLGKEANQAQTYASNAKDQAMKIYKMNQSFSGLLEEDRIVHTKIKREMHTIRAAQVQTAEKLHKVHVSLQRENATVSELSGEIESDAHEEHHDVRDLQTAVDGNQDAVHSLAAKEKNDMNDLDGRLKKLGSVETTATDGLRKDMMAHEHATAESLGHLHESMQSEQKFDGNLDRQLHDLSETVKSNQERQGGDLSSVSESLRENLASMKKRNKAEFDKTYHDINRLNASLHDNEKEVHSQSGSLLALQSRIDNRMGDLHKAESADLDAVSKSFGRLQDSMQHVNTSLRTALRDGLDKVEGDATDEMDRLKRSLAETAAEQEKQTSNLDSQFRSKAKQQDWAVSNLKQQLKDDEKFESKVHSQMHQEMQKAESRQEETVENLDKVRASVNAENKSATQMWKNLKDDLERKQKEDEVQDGELHDLHQQVDSQAQHQASSLRVLNKSLEASLSSLETHSDAAETMTELREDFSSQVSKVQKEVQSASASARSALGKGLKEAQARETDGLHAVQEDMQKNAEAQRAATANLDAKLSDEKAARKGAVTMLGERLREEERQESKVDNATWKEIHAICSEQKQMTERLYKVNNSVQAEGRAAKEIYSGLKQELHDDEKQESDDDGKLKDLTKTMEQHVLKEASNLQAAKEKLEASVDALASKSTSSLQQQRQDIERLQGALAEDQHDIHGLDRSLHNLNQTLKDQQLRDVSNLRSAKESLQASMDGLAKRFKAAGDKEQHDSDYLQRRIADEEHGLQRLNQSLKDQGSRENKRLGKLSEDLHAAVKTEGHDAALALRRVNKTLAGQLTQTTFELRLHEEKRVGELSRDLHAAVQSEGRDAARAVKKLNETLSTQLAASGRADDRRDEKISDMQGHVTKQLGGLKQDVQSLRRSTRADLRAGLGEAKGDVTQLKEAQEDAVGRLSSKFDEQAEQESRAIGNLTGRLKHDEWQHGEALQGLRKELKSRSDGLRSKMKALNETFADSAADEEEGLSKLKAAVAADEDHMDEDHGRLKGLSDSVEQRFSDDEHSLEHLKESTYDKLQHLGEDVNDAAGRQHEDVTMLTEKMKKHRHRLNEALELVNETLKDERSRGAKQDSELQELRDRVQATQTRETTSLSKVTNSLADVVHNEVKASDKVDSLQQSIETNTGVLKKLNGSLEEDTAKVQAAEKENIDELNETVSKALKRLGGRVRTAENELTGLDRFFKGEEEQTQGRFHSVKKTQEAVTTRVERLERSSRGFEKSIKGLNHSQLAARQAAEASVANTRTMLLKRLKKSDAAWLQRLHDVWQQNHKQAVMVDEVNRTLQATLQQDVRGLSAQLESLQKRIHEEEHLAEQHAAALKTLNENLQTAAETESKHHANAIANFELVQHALAEEGAKVQNVTRQLARMGKNVTERLQYIEKELASRRHGNAPLQQDRAVRADVKLLQLRGQASPAATVAQAASEHLLLAGFLAMASLLTLASCLAKLRRRDDAGAADNQRLQKALQRPLLES